jgi:hypothetical protein
MDMDVLHLRAPFNKQRPNTEPIRTVSPPFQQTGASSHLKPTLAYPSLLIIDADEERAQSLARILTLANYHPLIEVNPVQAFKRSLDSPLSIQAVLLGRVSKQHNFFLNRILQHLTYKQGLNIPVMSLPAQVPNRVPLYASAQTSAFHIPSQSCLKLLESIWNVIPYTRSDYTRAVQPMVSRLVPGYGMQPRVSQRLLSRNNHFRQVLQTAYDLMPTGQWETLLSDVGLAQYRRQTDWPSFQDHTYATPIEYLSCLNQAVAFSRPEDPITQLLRWGNKATQISLEASTPSTMMQRILKLSSPTQMIQGMLKAYTKEMNEIRGEQLHEWIPLPNGNYWLVCYSNLYSYGRLARLRSQPMCHVWLASIEAVLRTLNLDSAWKVFELECSCQTQTGHCLFGLQQT